jgi:hypothetical protein
MIVDQDSVCLLTRVYSIMFDRSTWRTQLGKRLDIFARNPQQDVILSGATSLLSHLAGCTLQPFLNQFEREPIVAVQVLASIAQGSGANSLVKRATTLHYQAARLLEQELRNAPALRADIEAIMVAMDTIHLVRQRLHGSREDWFRHTLTNELKTYPSNEFLQLRRRLYDRWQSFYDIFRELRQRQGSYTQEDLILLYVGLNDSSSNVRAEAARRLGEYAWTPPEKLISKLIHVALYDRDLETRNAAARALGALRERIASPHLMESIGQHLSSNDKFVRSAASLLLAELGELAGTEQLVDKLVALLSDADPYTREAAACALGRMGTAAVRAEVMNALTQALQDASDQVHGAALESLTQLRELRNVLTAHPNRPGTAPLSPSGAQSRKTQNKKSKPVSPSTDRPASQDSDSDEDSTPLSAAELHRTVRAASQSEPGRNGNANSDTPPIEIELGQ